MTPAPDLSTVPLFPLGTVLFPDGLLPLRVFEIRYIDMIGKCHAAGTPFGIVSLTEGAEVRVPGTTESFAAVGTLATIDHLQTPQPGLLLIQCAGTQRFQIAARKQAKYGLWVAQISPLAPDADVPIPEDLRPVALALETLLTNLERREASQRRPRSLRLNDCGWVANRWCELLPLALSVKQNLMQLDNPLVRLELVGDILARMRIQR